MFQRIGERLNGVLKRLKGQGVLKESNIQDALREIRLALLEADVHYRVVKDFLESVKERALGKEVLESLTPGQQFVKVVREELASVMGGSWEGVEIKGEMPFVLMLVGLQGSGKTTTAGKLALYFRKDRTKRPLLVPADPYRPAAKLQLMKIGKELGIDVFPSGDENDPRKIASSSLVYARENRNDMVILDTAGRLHIDDELMEELRAIRSLVKPHEILLVADSMTGQDAVRISDGFNQGIGIDGIILTKMDGDARGGAALSMKMVTGKPIKFIGTGERFDDLEPFHPERIAGRILGMGDVLTLIDRAVEKIDRDKAAELEGSLRKDTFTLEDFRNQILQIRRMGPLEGVLSMIPGFSALKNRGLKIDDRALTRIEAIINSMTKEERRNPSIINGKRRKRIANGSGTSLQEVNRLLKQYQQTKKLFKMFKKGGLGRSPQQALSNLFGMR